jgi:hypothetical protein
MAAATGSRGHSNETQVCRYPVTLPAGSQIGNDRTPKEARPDSLQIDGDLSPFLTGSDSQTEIDVTRSKQTAEKFLTGSRTAISVSRKHTANREDLELEHGSTN